MLTRCCVQFSATVAVELRQKNADDARKRSLLYHVIFLPFYRREQPAVSHLLAHLQILLTARVLHVIEAGKKPEHGPS